jgi:tRNA (guanine26-N2/guanine27-N2)-dimethyltransferase
MSDLATIPLVEVTEGTTTLLVPKTAHTIGPKKREGVPFYNPAMRLARDVSVVVLRTLVELDGRTFRVFDAMSATGARGIRLANEVPGTKVQLNDANSDAVSLAQQNVKRLGLTNVDFRVGRLESHIAAEHYDWVDIDPFGTPAPFIDAAVLGVLEDGILAVTATDTASLSGVYPDACFRRYNARPRRGDCMPELAARILVGAVVRAAGRRDRGAVPLLTYTTQHFVRTYVRLSGGAGAADASAKQLGFAVFGPGLSRRLQSEPAAPKTFAGPLWTGPLCDLAFMHRVRATAAQHPNLSKETTKLLERLDEEAAAPPLYYEIDDFTSLGKTNSPKLEVFLQRIRDDGHVATRTHFSDRGFKTDASPDQVMATLSRPLP